MVMAETDEAAWGAVDAITDLLGAIARPSGDKRCRRMEACMVIPMPGIRHRASCTSVIRGGDRCSKAGDTAPFKAQDFATMPDVQHALARLLRAKADLRHKQPA